MPHPLPLTNDKNIKIIFAPFVEYRANEARRVRSGECVFWRVVPPTHVGNDRSRPLGMLRLGFIQDILKEGLACICSYLTCIGILALLTFIKS